MDSLRLYIVVKKGERIDLILVQLLFIVAKEVRGKCVDWGFWVVALRSSDNFMERKVVYEVHPNLWEVERLFRLDLYNVLLPNLGWQVSVLWKDLDESIEVRLVLREQIYFGVQINFALLAFTL